MLTPKTCITKKKKKKKLNEINPTNNYSNIK